MQIKAFLERSGEQQAVELPEQATARDLLTELKINPETVLLVRAGTVILADTKLAADDEIRLLSVISGG